MRRAAMACVAGLMTIATACHGCSSFAPTPTSPMLVAEAAVLPFELDSTGHDTSSIVLYLSYSTERVCIGDPAERN